MNIRDIYLMKHNINKNNWYDYYNELMNYIENYPNDKISQLFYKFCNEMDYMYAGITNINEESFELTNALLAYIINKEVAA